MYSLVEIIGVVILLSQLSIKYIKCQNIRVSGISMSSKIEINGKTIHSPEPEIIETSDGTSIMNRNFVITDNKIIINKIDMINKKNPEKHLILKNKYCEYCKLMDTCNKLIGCECKSGWTGEFCDTKGI